MKTTLAILLTATALASAAQAESLTRVITHPLGAEVTGLFVAGSDLFVNVQHPNGDLGNRFDKATVGVIANANFAAAATPVPATDAEKSVVTSSLGAYQILARSGEMGAGVIRSSAGDVLAISNDPDFNGFVNVDENSGFLFTNWENRPGGISRAKLNRTADGYWNVESLEMLDLSAVRGTWINCFGTVSPWNTPLSAEELYFDNTADWNNPSYEDADKIALMGEVIGENTFANPYDYGFILEIADPAGTATPVKQRAMGRFSHENAVVMPDNKTVYLSDDGGKVVFFKFIADNAGDLSAGTLYAAKITQQGPAGADPATTALKIDWIKLAHGDRGTIEGWAREYDHVTPADYVEGATSYISDDEVAAWAEGKAKDDRAAFLETRKAAIAKGATAEFNKMEGVNINYDGAADGSVPYVYMAMTQITKSMSDGEGAIDLGENKCGVVYEMKLDADYNVDMMVPAVAGKGYDKAKSPNSCSVDSISSPDNIVVLRDGAVVIGEDTGDHENNMVWVYRK